jgi:chemotaxis protein CheX
MKAEYINPFLLSTIAAFDTMLQCGLTRGTPYIRNGSQPSHEVSGIIGLSGKAQGTVVVGLGREAALKIAEIMLQERPSEINADIVDAVGELANIIAGRAKSELEPLNMSISLPSVIIGKCHSIQFPSKITPICIPFESPWGTITVEVGLSEPAATP